MFNARGAEVSEPEEPWLSVSSVITGLAGSDRLGKHRLLPEESEPAGLAAGPLPAQAGGVVQLYHNQGCYLAQQARLRRVTGHQL